MLYIGEQVGQGSGPAVDVAVDPLEGTNIVATGGWSAMAVLAIAKQGQLLHAPDMYMDKIAVGPQAAGHIDLDAPMEDNLRAVARALGKDLTDLVVVMLDRPRHAEKIAALRQLGVRIKLLGDGDVAAALNTGFPDTGVDILLGSGGAPEGVLAAVGLLCLGGEMQGRLLPQNEEQLRRCREMGIVDPHRVLRMEDLVRGEDAIFAATGVTDGDLLKGVRFSGGGQATTESIVMRAKSGTIRRITTIHNLERKAMGQSGG